MGSHLTSDDGPLVAVWTSHGPILEQIALLSAGISLVLAVFGVLLPVAGLLWFVLGITVSLAAIYLTLWLKNTLFAKINFKMTDFLIQVVRHVFNTFPPVTYPTRVAGFRHKAKLGSNLTLPKPRFDSSFPRLPPFG